MKSNNKIKIVLTGCLSAAIVFSVVSTSSAALVKLSDEKAALIYGGDNPCKQACTDGGTCSQLAVAGCQSSENPAFKTVECSGAGMFCGGASYKMCSKGTTTCTAGGGSGGCGSQYTRKCTVNDDQSGCDTSDTITGACSKDCK